MAGLSRGAIRIGSLGSMESPVLMEADSGALYAQGHVLFLRGTTLMAQPFNAMTLKLAGEAVPIAEQVRNAVAYRAFSASTGGDLVYAGGTASGDQLTWFDRGGKRQGTLGEPGQMQRPFFSPDRKRLSVSLADPLSGNADIWIYEVERGLPSRFTFDPAAELSSVWSPDGGTIVFDSNRNGRGDLYRKKANGNGPEELLYADDRRKIPTSWAPDGRFLLYYTGNDPNTGNDIWVLPDPLGAPGAAKPYPFLQTRFNENNPRFSPDGRWVTYSSDESRRYEIYVAPFSDPARKRQISTSGGQYPRWRPDGKEVFYFNQGGQLMATEVSLNKDELELGRTTGPILGGIQTGAGTAFDVSADGRRFLAIVPPEQGSSVPLTWVQNWPAALRK